MARSSGRLWSWVVVAAFVVAPGCGVTQDSIVPPAQTAPYGPPACTPELPPAAPSEALEHALSEQAEALTDPSILSSADALPNFALERYKLLAYGDCNSRAGCYWADLDAQYRRAEAELKHQIGAHKRGEKLAVVMDIDETTLTNWCEMRREDFGYIGPMYSAWETSRDAATPIPGALRLFNEARAAGVAVFFITGRGGIPDRSAAKPGVDETEATARNLKTAGFHGWAGLRLRNGNERSMPTVVYKSTERSRIVQQGYWIVLNVGDQWSDLEGRPEAAVSVKLPNPFYFIP